MRYFQIEICPDAQSPELSVPCSSVPPGNGAGRGAEGGTLPFTGMEFLVWLFVAALLVWLGWLLVRRFKSWSLQSRIEEGQMDIESLIAVSVGSRGPDWDRTMDRLMKRQEKLYKALARYD